MFCLQNQQMKIIPFLPVFLHHPTFKTLFSYKIFPVFVFNKSGNYKLPSRGIRLENSTVNPYLLTGVSCKPKMVNILHTS